MPIEFTTYELKQEIAKASFEEINKLFDAIMSRRDLYNPSQINDILIWINERIIELRK